MTDASVRRYRPSKINEDITLYTISTVYYKNMIYNNLGIERNPIEPQKPGFCDFPDNYDEYYFEMLTAEEKISDSTGTRYDSKQRRNEALDCRVYALCASDVFLDSEKLTYRAWAKEKGASATEILKITNRTVIDNMISLTAVKNK